MMIMADKPARLNNPYKITVEAPLIRPGLRIETTVSEKYVEEAVSRVMGMVRRINEKENAAQTDSESKK